MPRTPLHTFAETGEYVRCGELHVGTLDDGFVPVFREGAGETLGEFVELAIGRLLPAAMVDEEDAAGHGRVASTPVGGRQRPGMMFELIRSAVDVRS